MMREIEVALAATDADQLTEILAATGRSLEDGLSILLTEGIAHYEADQREWERLSAAGIPDDDPVRMELQRREASAHLTSMRPRTVETEARMDQLRLQVLQTSSTYRKLRSQLRVLQDRQERLRGLIDRPLSPLASDRRESLWQRVRRFVGR